MNAYDYTTSYASRWADEEAENADPLRMFQLMLSGGHSSSDALSAVDVVSVRGDSLQELGFTNQGVCHK